MQFILTTLRAAFLHSMLNPKEAPKRFWNAGKAFLTHGVRGDLSARADARLIACRHCPIFDSKWRACGNGKDVTQNGQYVGCLCYMPVKVRIPSATCWLHDQGVTDEGWPMENQ